MNNINDFLTYQAPDNLLNDKIIVVSGAGDGIGKQAALSFAKHGATVVLLGRTLAKLESTYDQIEQEGGATPAIYPINFEGASEHDYDQLRSILKDTFGRVDGVLHNAGELGPRTPIRNYSHSEWYKVLQVNTTAPFMLTQTLLPLLEQSESGRILFTSSSVGVKGKAYWGAYAVSKAATDNLMEVLADELEETSIRVNSINPGATRTQMRATAYPAEDPTTVTKAESIMNQYLFLMGEDSSGWHGLQLNAQTKP